MPSFRYVAGLMSGTSLDGIDAVLLKIRGSGNQTVFRQVAHVRMAYPSRLRISLLRNSRPPTSRVDEITLLHAALALRYAAALKRLARAARIPLSHIDLVGSHGQTIHHLPRPAPIAGTRTTGTLQIGDPSALAAVTGIPVVGNFRAADMALGGQGAPLVPYFDWLVFRSAERNRALLNLGGIANITILPRDCTPDKVIAFDTGPGNMVIDALMRSLYGRKMDRGGLVGRSGMIIHDLLDWMKHHPYVQRRPPKSTGREEFGDEFLGRLLRRARPYDRADVIATAAEFTAWAVYDACRRFVPKKTLPAEVIVSGGGANNAAITSALGRYFGAGVVQRIERYGMSYDAKEAACFAVLANETVHGRPANLPSVTGARRAVVLGCVCGLQGTRNAADVRGKMVSEGWISSQVENG